MMIIRLPRCCVHHLDFQSLDGNKMEQQAECLKNEHRLTARTRLRSCLVAPVLLILNLSWNKWSMHFLHSQEQTKFEFTLDIKT